MPLGSDAEFDAALGVDAVESGAVWVGAGWAGGDGFDEALEDGLGESVGGAGAFESAASVGCVAVAGLLPPGLSQPNP